MKAFSVSYLGEALPVIHNETAQDCDLCNAKVTYFVRVDSKVICLRCAAGQRVKDSDKRNITHIHMTETKTADGKKHAVVKASGYCPVCQEFHNTSESCNRDEGMILLAQGDVLCPVCFDTTLSDTENGLWKYCETCFALIDKESLDKEERATPSPFNKCPICNSSLISKKGFWCYECNQTFAMMLEKGWLVATKDSFKIYDFSWDRINTHIPYTVWAPGASTKLDEKLEQTEMTKTVSDDAPTCKYGVGDISTINLTIDIPVTLTVRIPKSDIGNAVLKEFSISPAVMDGLVMPSISAIIDEELLYEKSKTEKSA